MLKRFLRNFFTPKDADPLPVERIRVITEICQAALAKKLLADAEDAIEQAACNGASRVPIEVWRISWAGQKEVANVLRRKGYKVTLSFEYGHMEIRW